MHEKIWEGNGKQSVKQLETIQTAAAKKGTRMLKHDEQYSIKSRTGNAPT